MDFLKQAVTPWFSSERVENIDRLLTLLVLASLVFSVLVGLAIGGDLTEFLRTQFNTVVLLFLGIFSYTMMNQSKNYASFGYGGGISIGLIVGILVGIVMMLRSLFISHPPLEITTFSIIGSLYVALIVPFIEEKFFGQNLPFIIQNVVKNSSISMLLTALIFGGFHLVAYGASIPLMISAIFFRVIILLGNGFFKSGTFGMSAHYMNNILDVLSKIR